MKPAVPTRLGSQGLTAAIVLGTVGALTILILPGFVLLIGAQSGLGDRQLGFVASWDINSMAAFIGLATFVISRLNWRQLGIAGIALIALGDLLTALNHGYPGIIAARVCAGAGEGLAVAVSFAALGSAANPDRAFGIYLIVCPAVAAGILAVLPAAQDRFGAANIFFALGALALVCGTVVAWLPARHPGAAAWAGTPPPVAKGLALAGLLGAFLNFLAEGAMWTYFGRIGAASAVAPATIGAAMGLSSFAGMGGALFAVSVCNRLGRVIPLALSGVVSVVSFWMLKGHVAGTTLILSGALLYFAWNLAQPLFSGVCAEADAQGRVVVAMGCIQTVGFGIGPAIAAMMLRGNDFSPVIWMSIGVLLISMILVIGGIKTHERRARNPSSEIAPGHA
jgi:predicted MFS family arabinose efflux permease